MPFARHFIPHGGLVAVLGLLAPAAVSAQDMGASAGFAVTIAQSPDYYEMPDVNARLFGMTAAPASGYVRGCPGYVTDETAGAAFEVEPGFDRLAFSAYGDGVKAMVLETPDGLYRCALADERGLVSQALARPAPGLYRVWAAAREAVMLDARLIVSLDPVSPIAIFGLDVSRLGPPRLGDFTFNATADVRQELALGATLHAEQEMAPLSADYCAGYGRLDAPDARLTLTGTEERVSVFASSMRDLTMAVVAPDGRVTCNDDAYQLNPAVTIEGPVAGDYLIFVGGFTQGPGDVYDLYAALGNPAFGTGSVDVLAPPRNGRVTIDLTHGAAGQPVGTGRLSAFEPMEILGGGGFCPGYSDLSAPDYVVALDQSQPMLSVAAQSALDLVMAVHTPSGEWICNDDTFELNPAVTVSQAPAGDYAIYIGAYAQYGEGSYELTAALGEPVFGGSAGMVQGTTMLPLNDTAAPILGAISFAGDTVIDPRIIFDVRASGNDVFGLGEGCAGFIDPSAPDVVVDVAEGLEQVMIYMVSDADGTLAVIAPDGSLHCNDDFEMLNPGVLFDAPQAGGYRVFAGTYGGAAARATLGVTRGSPLWAMDSVQ